MPFQVWALIHRASKLMKGATGNACNMDVLCWCVHGHGPYAENACYQHTLSTGRLLADTTFNATRTVLTALP